MDQAPDLFAMGIPLFMLLFLIEIIATVLRKKDWYRITDTINTLSTGVLNISSNTLSKFMTIAIYNFFLQFAPQELPSSALWVWVVGFIAYDVCYYWNHRLGHERNILWAAHSVHHQSEEYNLATSFRQTSFSWVFSWVFYVPMALAGIPLYVFIFAGTLDLLYQFWIHTRHIPKLGWLENIMVTPSSHRVHHGCNPRYMDKNYGGVFIIWDRLFGSYQEELEDEPVRYGISTPLRSWNPIWANVAFYHQLARDSWYTAHWRDKLRIWFMPTGWRPADVNDRFPLEKRDEHYQKFDAHPQPWLQWYFVLQFFMVILGLMAFLSVADQQSLAFNAIMSSCFAMHLYWIGKSLENREGIMNRECVRLLTCLPIYLFWQYSLTL
ncbi:sterol desaturase family protein [Pseudoteredinibacter isoporae]|uniref:sterol desaturase family protein n=1 Tax=Pseudoteredinibacter isoporae TaxID=570281 RepID=UPI003104D95A